jgi:hypothetical protein
MGREKDFSEKIKLKCLLWSDRHCCVCGKPRGLDLEVHHIEPEGGNNLDNAIPVCYDCHATLGRYVDSHPRGNKPRIEEIKKRRDQIYERYTRKLIPGILPVIHPRFGEKTCQFPNVGFSVSCVGRFIPVKARIVVKTFLGDKKLDQIDQTEKPYYSGGIIWNLNPGLVSHGWFTLPSECVNSTEVKLEINISVIDPFEREHELLPLCFTYVHDKDYWYLEPTSFAELKRAKTRFLHSKDGKSNKKF